MKLNYYNYFEKRAVIILILLLISAFGPYILPNYGIRLEHVIIYPIFIIVIFKSVFFDRMIKINRYSVAIIFLLYTLIILVSIITLYNGRFSFGALNTIENLMQPIAIITILGGTTYGLNYFFKQKLIVITCWVIAILLSINALIALISIFIDVWPFIKYFVSINHLENGAMGSVWGRSANMGRFIGVFNQPVEAGVAYTLAAFGIVYLANKKKYFSNLLFLLLILVIIGGLLTVSKVFMIGGIILLLVYLMWTKIISKLFSFRIIVLVSLAVFTIAINLKNWVGLSYFMRFFSIDFVSFDSLLDLLTSGRISKGSSVSTTFSEILIDSPLFGYGIVGYNVTLDNGLLYYFFHGGGIGLFVYIGVLISILLLAVLGIINNKKEGKFLLMIFMIIIGADLGAPAVIMNRASIFLWILIYLNICLISEVRKFQVGIPVQLIN